MPVRPLCWEHEGNRAIREGKWKLVALGPAAAWELYDMEADRTEMHDLAKEQPERVLAMASRWESWAGAALGAAAAATVTLFLVRPIDTAVNEQPQLALTVHETRNVDVLIDSERELKGATIRIAASGSIALDGKLPDGKRFIRQLYLVEKGFGFVITLVAPESQFPMMSRDFDETVRSLAFTVEPTAAPPPADAGAPKQ